VRMHAIFSQYSLKYAEIIVYMLQSTEYQALPYLRWYWRTNDFSRVIRRRTLDKTTVAKVLLFTLRFGIFVQVTCGFALIGLNLFGHIEDLWQLGTALVLSYPVVWAHLIVAPLMLGDLLIIKPRNKKLISRSKQIFSEFQGVKIAVAGSYGKTTMKEILNVVLSEGKHVSVTPANKNTAISHAQFALTLTGRENVLVVEFGEGRPGDVSKFTRTVVPQIGVITGIAPAHLDHYRTVDEAARDIFSLADFLRGENTFVNEESSLARPYIKNSYTNYSSRGVGRWKISNIKISVHGTSFNMVKHNKKLKLRSGLLGRHQVGPLAAAVAIADLLGLDENQIQHGVAKTKAFEHRMEAKEFHGAWIIDDTYNGNIEGVRAGLELLAELPAKRRIYVTPGLVDQGVETKKVHIRMGFLIAKFSPDQLVLMRNSVTDYIHRGLVDNNFKGKLLIVDDPLEYYTNLEHYLATGDVIMLQNDWTDNYT